MTRPTATKAPTQSVGNDEHFPTIGISIKGEFYPCKPDIFEATYDPVAEEVPDGK